MNFPQKTVLFLILGLSVPTGSIFAQTNVIQVGGEEVVGADTKVLVEEVRVQAEKEKVYVVEETGRSTLRSTFAEKKDTPVEQWDFAKKTWDKGRLKKAADRMLYLYRRWPNSKEAPWAARARADIQFERKKWKDAFSDYQYLIDNYSGRMVDYDSVLERQFEIAVKIMKRRRMRWLFGGYRAPEYAVEYFEGVNRNGPQWKRAPEAQYMVGKCNQDSKEYELAISAYAVLGYRYPDSEYAEEAAWQQVQCLIKLRQDFPSSPEILDRTLTATTVYLSTYPASERKSDIIQLRNELYEVKAGRVFNEAAFYAKVPKEPEAAIIYYEKMIEEYPRSERVPDAEKRIAELKELLAMPLEARTPLAPRSRPIPFTKGPENEES
ncbi:outer membrane protein assembly factor BamD [Pontiellaceae bacterium B1224]|nr:outer membrane protein assembly factor BamD [Pontiellaceae bacterium B1224]